MDDDLEAMFDRMRGWPAERKERALGVLIAIERSGESHFPPAEEDVRELDDAPYALTDAELADIREGVAEADRREFLTDGEVRHLFRQRT